MTKIEVLTWNECTEVMDFIVSNTQGQYVTDYICHAGDQAYFRLYVDNLLPQDITALKVTFNLLSIK